MVGGEGDGAANRCDVPESAHDDEHQHLVTRAATGDRAAVEVLLARLRPLLLRYFRARLPPDDRSGWADPEDCTQEVLVVLYRALQPHRRPPVQVLPFAYGIAAHKLADLRRQQARDRALTVTTATLPCTADPAPGPLETASYLALLARFVGLLAGMTTLQRTVLVQQVLLGRSTAEAAVLLGLPTAGAVRAAKARALSQVRRDPQLNMWRLGTAG